MGTTQINTLGPEFIGKRVTILPKRSHITEMTGILTGYAHYVDREGKRSTTVYIKNGPSLDLYADGYEVWVHTDAVAR